MSPRYFGTDGIRGRFRGALINRRFFFQLGRAVARHLGTRRTEGGAEFVVGRDNRLSGEELEAAFIDGLGCMKVSAISLGVAPTPAVALIVRDSEAAMGAVITASHNPAHDNGIKFFDDSGRKLDEEEERSIEQLVDNLSPRPETGSADVVVRWDGARIYRERVRSLFSSINLNNWTIAVDTANGATVETTPWLLRDRGAELVTIGDCHNGGEINRGVGSEYPQRLAIKAGEGSVRLGIAHDGDGDRAVFCDETGSILDGDEVLAIFGLHALRSGALNGRTLVTTVQSNLALDQTLEKAGGCVERVPVGDRNVSARMLESGYNVGGESSGHFIFGDYSPSGDGLIAVMKLLEIVQLSGKSLAELRRCIALYPIRKCNLRIAERIPLDELPSLLREIEELERSAGGRGRLLVRYSGTEAVIRLLVEGEDAAWAESGIRRLRASVAEHLTVL